jgi:hypothetical protein
MAHLYEALAWTIDEPERPREYVVHANGELLANITRVKTRRPDDAAMPYANPHAQYDESRIVVCATDPAGTPYFYVDRVNDPMTAPQPALVVAPDGKPLGSVAVHTGGVKGIFKLLFGRVESGYALMDAQGQNLAIMVSPPLTAPTQEGTVTDSRGEEIARYNVERSPYSDRRRRYTMRLRNIAPEPLRTVLFASLIGVELMAPDHVTVDLRRCGATGRPASAYDAGEYSDAQHEDSWRPHQNEAEVEEWRPPLSEGPRILPAVASVDEVDDEGNESADHEVRQRAREHDAHPGLASLSECLAGLGSPS